MDQETAVVRKRGRVAATEEVVEKAPVTAEQEEEALENDGDPDMPKKAAKGKGKKAAKGKGKKAAKGKGKKAAKGKGKKAAKGKGKKAAKGKATPKKSKKGMLPQFNFPAWASLATASVAILALILSILK